MKKIIFLRIGWMKKYQGLSDDRVSYGGSAIQKHEAYNFRPEEGKMYGFVESPGIDISKLGAKKGDKEIDNILTIWVVRKDDEGCYIVGWFNHSKVFRKREALPNTVNRVFTDKSIVGEIPITDYLVSADEKNCTLLEATQRTIKVPTGKHGFGEDPIWYASENEYFKNKVVEYINRWELNKIREGKVNISNLDS